MISKISKIRSTKMTDDIIRDIDDLIEVLYPIGCIYKSVNPENPSMYFGGEWVPWGAGKAIAGVDEEDPDFNEPEKEGGSKDAIVVSHNHTQNSHTHTHTGSSHSHGVGTISFASAGAHTHDVYINISRRVKTLDVGLPGQLYPGGYTNLKTASISTVSGGAHTHSGSGSLANATKGGSNTAVTATNQAIGESGEGKNLQPYITCYMWKRVA